MLFIRARPRTAELCRRFRFGLRFLPGARLRGLFLGWPRNVAHRHRHTSSLHEVAARGAVTGAAFEHVRQLHGWMFRTVEIVHQSLTLSVSRALERAVGRWQQGRASFGAAALIRTSISDIDYFCRRQRRHRRQGNRISALLVSPPFFAGGDSGDKSSPAAVFVSAVSGYILSRRQHESPVNKGLSPLSPLSPPKNINCQVFHYSSTSLEIA